jgi:hypothetical protein
LGARTRPGIGGSDGSRHDDVHGRGRSEKALEQLQRQAEGRAFAQQERDEWNSLNETLDGQQTRRQRLDELAKNPASWEDGTPYEALQAVRDEELLPHVRGSREAALRANERAVFLPEKSREHMERKLREDDDPSRGSPATPSMRSGQPPQASGAELQRRQRPGDTADAVPDAFRLTNWSG